ncbi:MAG: aspartate/glutamate racemase family protein [Anaeromyxobacteraceae bacterium]
MARHIGIVACSSEGAALCYRTVCVEAAARMGEHAHPQVSLHGHSLRDYMDLLAAGDRRGVADLMLSSAEALARAGAGFLVCPDNTIHEAFELVEPRSPLPWLHFARVVAAEARRRGHTRLGVLGTRYLMEGPVYPAALDAVGVAHEVPPADDRLRLDAIIFDELVKGRCEEASRREVVAVIARLRARGCDAVVLGCTELPLLVAPGDAPLPALDSTRLLARAAIDEALRP